MCQQSIRIPASPPLFLLNTQAFVDEVVNVGELRWLEEWKDSKDRKALLAKVLLHQPSEILLYIGLGYIHGVVCSSMVLLLRQSGVGIAAASRTSCAAGRL